MLGRYLYVHSLTTLSLSLSLSQTNALPIPYMVRSSKVYDIENTLKPSGCAEYKVVLQQRSLASFAKEMLVGGHGHLHELLGGSFGFKKSIRTRAHLTAKDPAYWGRYGFAHRTEGASKELWRKGYLTCPGYGSESCPYVNIKRFHSRSDELTHYRTLMEGTSSHTSSFVSPKDKGETKQCSCSCTAAMYGTTTEVATILQKTGIIGGLKYFDLDKNKFLETLSLSFSKSVTNGTHTVRIAGYTAEESAAMISEIRDFLCDLGAIGDNFQATSSNDPTFWVMHTQMERLWHLVRINTDAHRIAFDETWDDVAYSSCVGQRTTDATPFKNIFDNRGTVYTNKELYALLDPNRDDLPFMYDNFRLPHCELLNYDMTGLSTKKI